MGRTTVVGNIRTFIGNALGSVTGRTSIAAWAVAATAAYFLIVKPQRERQLELEARAALSAEKDRYRYVEKRRPIPDPQDTGLIRGSGKGKPENGPSQ